VCLAISNQPLFKEPLIAWDHGPVVKDVYDEYKDNKSNLIEYNPVETDCAIIQRIENDEDVRDILEFVIEEYGQYTAWKLRNMTHDERPWNETIRNQIISNQIIKEYFLEEVVEVG
ncbi:MAG: Panacea domain-containing protein, partial [Clostridium sp.]